MTTWECKRCFLQTSADHKPADCISALRRAYQGAMKAGQKMAAMVEELQATKATKVFDEKGNYRRPEHIPNTMVAACPCDRCKEMVAATAKRQFAVNQLIVASNGPAVIVREITAADRPSWADAFARGSRAWEYRYPDTNITAWDFERNLRLA